MDLSKMEMGDQFNTLLEDARKERLLSRSRRSASHCPGGVGQFGFNSYDLLTLTVLTFSMVGNVIVNSNKNENNNNNNDLQASFGSVTSNKESATSQQTNTNGAMIISPPFGPPIVIPTGRRLMEAAAAGEEDARVGWESEEWIAYDDGEIIFKRNGTRSLIKKGL